MSDEWIQVVSPTDPSNAFEESFELRVMDALWGIPDPDDVEDEILSEAAERMQQMAEDMPELVPDEMDTNYRPRRSGDHQYTGRKRWD